MSISRLLAIFIFLLSCQQKEVKGEEFVIQSMESYQRFSQKLWFAGQAENWELADFYTHEIHEVTEELIEGDVYHDGRNLSKLAEDMIESKIEDMDKAIDAENEELFVKNYLGLINACNACHTAAEYEFIKIRVPTINPFNQNFSVPK